MPKPNVRDKLLTAGLDTIHRLGFNGCSIQNITQTADVPKGSFYNHFESKEAFSVEILDLYWQKMINTSLKLLRDETLRPIERLKQYFNVLEQSLGEQNYEQGCLFGNLGTELPSQSRLVQERLSSLFAAWTRAIESCIRDAQIAGEIRADIKAADLAALLVNAWEGTVLRAKVDRDGRSLTQFSTVIFSAILT